MRLPHPGRAGIFDSGRSKAASSTSLSGRIRKTARRFGLTLAVHSDAFALQPLGYLQAVFWRMRGLRLRSRNRLAALMGHSPRAYALWIERIEPQVRNEFSRPATSAVKILPVVDCSASHDSIGATLQSIDIAGGELRTIVVGADTAVGVTRVARPEELADLVDRSGDWLCIIGPGDRLAPEALQIYAATASCSNASWVIYADDDLIRDDRRRDPHFKPSWNPELFEHHDFISGSAIIRVTPDMLSGLAAQDWAVTLVRRAIQRGGPPVHVPLVLHHRVARPAPATPAKSPSFVPENPPLVSVIVPTRNGLTYLRTCVEGLGRTAYPAIQLIVVDNGSDDADALRYLEKLARDGVTVLRVKGPFNFSALNNKAVECADGELLCFLNNDVEMLDPDWLALLVQQATRADLGAVGCRLLYPDGSVQHAGVVTGVGGGAAHAHRMLDGRQAGYFMRDRLPQRISAVTAACLVVAKSKFVAVGGFNEQEFPVAFNDVDLCLKLNARGWQCFYEPRAVLIHHESKSRGSDSTRENRDRFAAELAALKRHWRTDRERDPFHHPHLSSFCEQFLIGL